jgi:hypothetical protein
LATSYGMIFSSAEELQLRLRNQRAHDEHVILFGWKECHIRSLNSSR